MLYLCMIKQSDMYSLVDIERFSKNKWKCIYACIIKIPSQKTAEIAKPFYSKYWGIFLNDEWYKV
jgi:hypothetical protein